MGGLSGAADKDLCVASLELLEMTYCVAAGKDVHQGRKKSGPADNGYVVNARCEREATWSVVGIKHSNHYCCQRIVFGSGDVRSKWC